MDKKIFKIGQEVVFNEDTVLNSIVGEEQVQIKKGDKAFICNNGFLNHTTGNARGRTTMTNLQVKGYDYGAIANLIFDSIECYGIEEFLEDYDFDKKEFVEEIEMILIKVL